MKQGLERAYESGSNQAGNQGSVRSTVGDFGADFHNVVPISAGISDWQSFDVDGAVPAVVGKGPMSLGASLKLANWLNSNRICLAMAAIAAFAAAALAAVQLGGPVGEKATTALAILAPGTLFAHIASRQMSRLALTRRLWLFMPVFVLAMVPTLTVAALVGGSKLLITSLAGAMAAAAWYVLSEAALERFCHRRYGLVGDWAVLMLPIDRRSLFRQLRPASSLDGLDAIVVASSFQDDQKKRLHGLIQRSALKGIEILSVPAFCERMTGRTRRDALGPDPYLHSPAPTYLKLRRMADIALALLLLVPFGLIITISALIVRLESPGPAIYRQTRVGQRRVPFICYKLRSMRTDVSGSAFTVAGDPRITRYGAIMRKWRIDEMPQIWNVLRGDMSWIGPRPEAIPLAAQYRRNIPNYSYRYLVPPGITGWAAVHQGNVGEVDAAKVKLEYDFYYIRHLSFWMDVLVILKTVRTVLTGFGSR
jgi:lipopolysaccharide/colanic/teichoic acid biosynthesis glycosyltransferase